MKPYSAVLVRLLQGTVYSENSENWNLLLTNKTAIREYFDLIGLELFVLESEGMAFLRQKIEEGMIETLPELMQKRQLSYPQSLLAVLLAERLYKYDAEGGNVPRLVISREDVKNMMETFLPEKSNQAKMMDSLDGHINKLAGFGFLKILENGNDLEVRRILKARLDINKLTEIKEKLEEYAGSVL